MMFSRILFVTAILHTFSCSPPDLNDPATLNEAKKEAIPLSALTKEFKYGMAWLFVEENNETFSGWVKETHPNQSLKKLGYLKNGQRQGHWIEWYENGLKKSNIMWNLDRLSGEYFIWYQNK
jgi:antitoxin component YwqK of YwqJK toxin-antitoxin module